MNNEYLAPKVIVAVLTEMAVDASVGVNYK